MRFSHQFSRFLGASTDPSKQLGQATDLAPNTAGLGSNPQSPSDDIDNVLISKFTNSSGWPLQRLVMGYSYIGAGVAPATLPGCYIWVWDARTVRWYRMPVTFALNLDQISLSDVVSLMEGGPRNQATLLEPSVGGLEAWLAIPNPGGAPDGEYRFIIGPDMSSVP